MSNLKPPVQGTSVAEILARVKISEVYCVLTEKRPRPVGPNSWRGPAVWRGGDGHNVSLNDTRNVWHDFTANEGGGVLDLVVRICGGSRQDALPLASGFRWGLSGQPTAVGHGAGRLGEATAAD
jgi:hypothetical protein